MKTVFVSSTFQDMQYERDLIRDWVMPLVNSEARTFGQSVDFCDLRWGINTREIPEEHIAEKIMDVCLDEIDRSQPPMIILLGDRYGWIPGITETADIVGRYGLTLKKGEPSITELEVVFGAFVWKKEPLFFIREIIDETGNLPPVFQEENEKNRTKLAALKNRILAAYPENVIKYRLVWSGDGFTDESLRAFCVQVKNSLTDAMLPDWEKAEKLSPMEKLISSQWNYIDEKAKSFHARKAEAQYVSDLVGAADIPTIIIKGDEGMGKSTLFSHIAKEMKTRGWDVLPLICGQDPETSDVTGIMNTVINILQDRIVHPLQFDENEELRERYDRICESYVREGHRLAIMIDATERLLDDEYRKTLAFVPRVKGDSLKIIITCPNNFPTYSHRYLELKELNSMDKGNVLDALLRKHHKNGLHEQVRNALMSHPRSGNPLFLSLLFLRLIIMDRDDYSQIGEKGGGDRAIEEQQVMILQQCPEMLDAMFTDLMKEAGRRIEPWFTTEVMDYLAVSRNGLRTGDLAALLGDTWNSLDFAHLINYLPECFMIRDDGRYDLMHECLRRGWLVEKERQQKLHRNVFEHLDNLPITDVVKRKEYLYHCMKISDRDAFSDYVDEIFRDGSQIPTNEMIDYLDSASDCVRSFCLEEGSRWLSDELYMLASDKDYRGKVGRFVQYAMTLSPSRMNNSRFGKNIMVEILEAVLALNDGIMRSYPENDRRRSEWADENTWCRRELREAYLSLGMDKDADRILLQGEDEKKVRRMVTEEMQEGDFVSSIFEAENMMKDGSPETLREAIDMIEHLIEKELDLRIPEKEAILHADLGAQSVDLEMLTGMRHRKYRDLGGIYLRAYHTLAIARSMLAIAAFKQEDDMTLASNYNEIGRIITAIENGIELADPKSWGVSYCSGLIKIRPANNEEKKTNDILRKVHEGNLIQVKKIKGILGGFFGEPIDLKDKISYNLEIVEQYSSIVPGDLPDESFAAIQIDLVNCYGELADDYRSIGEIEKSLEAERKRKELANEQ